MKTRGKQDMCFRCVSSLFKANVAEAGAGRLKLGAPYPPLQPLMLVILFVFENSMWNVVDVSFCQFNWTLAEPNRQNLVGQTSDVPNEGLFVKREELSVLA